MGSRALKWSDGLLEHSGELAKINGVYSLTLSCHTPAPGVVAGL